MTMTKIVSKRTCYPYGHGPLINLFHHPPIAQYSCDKLGTALGGLGKVVWNRSIIFMHACKANPLTNHKNILRRKETVQIPKNIDRWIQ